jgi:hypothetical protein
MEEDISKEIDKIVAYCRARECEDCQYLINLISGNICALHNPSAWEV